MDGSTPEWKILQLLARASGLAPVRSAARAASQWTFLLLLLLSAAALPLHAQQEAGDIELQITGSVLTTSRDGGSSTSGIFQAKAGYFLTDRIEVGGFPSLTFTSVTVRSQGWPDIADETISESKLGMGAFATYSFLAADASTVPYVGGQFYRIDLTDDDETGWLGANGGVKLYVNPRTALDAGGNILLGLGDRGGTLFLFQFGLSHLL